MTSFVETSRSAWLLGSLLVGSSACYGNQASDEPLTDFDEPSVAADAATTSRDAAQPTTSVDAGPKCATSDPISQLLCALAPPAAQPTTPDLTALLGSLGGLANVADVLGAVLGLAPQRQQAGQPSLTDLVNLAGGLSNIAQLFNGLLGGGQAQSLPALFNDGRSQATLPSLTEVLSGFGIPVQGTQASIAHDPTAEECVQPATPAIQFACALQRAQ
jgi:hypothetical protein